MISIEFYILEDKANRGQYMASKNKTVSDWSKAKQFDNSKEAFDEAKDKWFVRIVTVKIK